METLQWTLLVGLLAMLAYVLWHRMKASMTKGVAPQVLADWSGEGWMTREGEWVLTIKVEAACEVRLSLSQDASSEVLHDGMLEAGTYEFTTQRHEGEGWVATLVCPGHRSERFWKA